MIITRIGSLNHIQFVQYLADGWTMKEISVQEKLGIRTLEARLKTLKKQVGAINTNHLIANYFRKKLIK